MPARPERPRLAALPPPGEGEERAARAPGPGRRATAALLLLALLAAVALAGWIASAREAGRLEEALAARERALEAARGELRAWERHRDAVSARLEAFSEELATLRDLVKRGPATSPPPAPEPPPEP